MSQPRLGGIALIIFATAGVAWFALELTPPRLGFADTDDPAVSLDFLRQHGITYAYAGLALITMAASLLVGVLVVSDRLVPSASSLATRATAAFGLTSALFYFGHGVLRSSVGPMLYIEELDPAWGQSAYLTVQMAGLHGFAQGAILAFSAWAVLVSVIGARYRTIPRWVAILGIFPAFRLVTSLLGPVGVLEGVGDIVWVLSMGAIIGSMIWPLSLGLWLLLGRPEPAL